MKQRLDALERSSDGVQAAHADPAPRQGYIERLRGQLPCQPEIRQFRSATVECSLEFCLRLVDARAGCGPVRCGEFAQRFEQLAELPGLA